MTSPKYMMITVAACTSSFIPKALEHLGVLTEELKRDAGAVTTRYGIIATGEHTGQIILFQTYEEMNGIDAAFDVYNNSAAYAGIVGSGHVSITLRNIVKIEDVALANPSSEVPAYGVVTRWGCPDLKLDALRAEVPNFESNGAMILRYCTILTGPTAGRHLLIVGYPSMDAIEKTYNDLRKSAGYNALLEEFDLDWRNIVRISG